MKILRNSDDDATDDDLVLRYKTTGNMQFLAAVYQRYMHLVYGVCLKYLKQPAAAEDAVMSIFEELVIKLKLHEVQNFKSWLYVLSRNYCLGLLRRQNVTEMQYIDEGVMEIPAQEHLDIDGLREEKLTSMEACMDELAAEQRVCVGLFYLQKMCYADIVAKTGYEMGKVKSYIQNGKRNLKLCIEKKTNARDD